MRLVAVLITALAVSAVSVGCRSTVCNDDFVHKVYYSADYQRLLDFNNEKFSVSALAETEFARRWDRFCDSLGAEGYYKLHLWLNPKDTD